MTTVNERLGALHASSARLASLATSLTPEQLVGPAYPSKWTIADVLSHIGSGAVIMRRGIDAAVSGVPVEDGFNQSVWDDWNAKSPQAQAAAALAADSSLMDRINDLSDDERASFSYAMGPFMLDFVTFVGLRLNEHVLHTWDVDVVSNADATLPSDAVRVVIDNLEMIAGFAGKSDGAVGDITVRTTDPDRHLVVNVGAERLSLESSTDAEAADAEMPAEAFIRLVYGRLDPAHTPDGVGGPAVDRLRSVFRGV